MVRRLLVSGHWPWVPSVRSGPAGRHCCWPRCCSCLWGSAAPRRVRRRTWRTGKRKPTSCWPEPWTKSSTWTRCTTHTLARWVIFLFCLFLWASPQPLFPPLPWFSSNVGSDRVSGARCRRVGANPPAFPPPNKTGKPAQPRVNLGGESHICLSYILFPLWDRNVSASQLSARYQWLALTGTCDKLTRP